MNTTGLKKVKVIHDIKAGDFYQEIINANQPVILKGLVNDWPIVQKSKQSTSALFAYLNEKAKNSNALLGTFEGEKDIKGRYFYNEGLKDKNFKFHKETLTDALKRIYKLRNNDDGTSAYSGSIKTSEHLPEFPTDNPSPLGLGNAVEPRIWLGNSATISIHFDETDNIACLVSGKRTFTLFPTVQVKNLYPGPIDNTIAGAPMSMVNVDEPDFEKHPLYREALQHAQVAELDIGDGLYIPPLWWHTVKSEGALCTLVNYFWKHDNRKLESPMNFLLHGLYTLSHLTPEEKANWKALVDHFIFNVNGEPMEHLSKGERGVFDDITPDHAYDIRDYMLREMGFYLGDIVKGKYSLKFD